MNSFEASPHSRHAAKNAAESISSSFSDSTMALTVSENSVQNDESTRTSEGAARFRGVKHGLQALFEDRKAVRQARDKFTEAVSTLAAASSTSDLLEDSLSAFQRSYGAAVQQYDAFYQEECDVWWRMVKSNHSAIMALGDAIGRMHQNDPHAIGDARIYSSRAIPDSLLSITNENRSDQRSPGKELSVSETLSSSGLRRLGIAPSDFEAAYLEHRKSTTFDDRRGGEVIADHKRKDADASTPDSILRVTQRTTPVRSKAKDVVHVLNRNDTASSSRQIARETPPAMTVSPESSIGLWRRFRQRDSNQTPAGRPDDSQLTSAGASRFRDGIGGYGSEIANEMRSEEPAWSPGSTLTGVTSTESVTDQPVPKAQGREPGSRDEVALLMQGILELYLNDRERYTDISANKLRHVPEGLTYKFMITHQVKHDRKIDHVQLLCQRGVGGTVRTIGQAWTSDVSKTRKTGKFAVSSQARPELLDKAHAIANIAVDQLDCQRKNIVTLFMTRHYEFDAGWLYSLKFKSAREAEGGQIRTWVDYHWEPDIVDEEARTLERKTSVVASPYVRSESSMANTARGTSAATSTVVSTPSHEDRWYRPPMRSDWKKLWWEFCNQVNPVMKEILDEYAKARENFKSAPKAHRREPEMEYSIMIIHNTTDLAMAHKVTLTCVGSRNKTNKPWCLFWKSHYEEQHAQAAGWQIHWTDEERKKVLPIANAIAAMAYDRRRLHNSDNYVEGMTAKFGFDGGTLKARKFRHFEDRTWVTYYWCRDA